MIESYCYKKKKWQEWNKLTILDNQCYLGFNEYGALAWCQGVVFQSKRFIMNISIRIFIFLTIFSCLSCGEDPDSLQPDHRLIDGLSKISVSIRIQNAAIERTFPSAIDNLVKDTFYYSFGTESGNFLFDENVDNSLEVKFDHTDLFGLMVSGSLNLQLRKEGTEILLTMEGLKEIISDSRKQTIGFTLADLPSTGDDRVSEGNGKASRYIIFDFDGEQVCNYLNTRTLPNYSLNPVYIWDQVGDYTDELVDFDCGDDANLIVRLIYEVK
jgi:hypothetical protein